MSQEKFALLVIVFTLVVLGVVYYFDRKNPELDDKDGDDGKGNV